MSKPQETKLQPTQQTQKPYFIFGLPFASRKVVQDFLLATFLIVVVPIIAVGLGNQYFKDAAHLSNLQKVAYAVVPTLIYMNIVIGVYIYKVIKDPENHKKDPPLVIRAKKND